MYCNCLSSINYDLEYQLCVRKEYEKLLHRIEKDDLRLHRSPSHGKEYYYAIRGKGKEREEIYLGDASHPLVRELKRKRFLEEVLDRIDGNAELLRDTLQHYRSVDPNVIRKELPRTYQFEDPQLFKVAGTIDLHRWEEWKATRGTFYDEELRHIAADGIRVRSKSEVIIANALAAAGIPYIYERPLRIGRITIHPDFTLYSPRWNRRVLWEHFGLMHSESYRRNYADKLALYAEAGYYLGSNLITTFDDANGNIDGQIIDELIRFWL